MWKIYDTKPKKINKTNKKTYRMREMLLMFGWLFGFKITFIGIFSYWYFTCFVIWCLCENLYVPCHFSLFLLYLYLDILICIAKMRFFFFPVFTPTIMRGILLVLVLVFLDLAVHLRELGIKGGWTLFALITMFDSLKLIAFVAQIFFKVSIYMF